jgi:hypothetical protein
MTSRPLRCQRPDRDVPGIVCGYPLPCPHHTFIIFDYLSFEKPKGLKVDKKTLERLKDIARAVQVKRK